MGDIFHPDNCYCQHRISKIWDWPSPGETRHCKEKTPWTLFKLIDIRFQPWKLMYLFFINCRSLTCRSWCSYLCFCRLYKEWSLLVIWECVEIVNINKRFRTFMVLFQVVRILNYLYKMIKDYKKCHTPHYFKKFKKFNQSKHYKKYWNYVRTIV